MTMLLCFYLLRIPLQSPWPTNEPKAPVAIVYYHAVIGTNIPVNRMAKKPGWEYMASLNGEV